MTKYIRMALVAMLPALLLTACVSFEEDDLFEDSAALRLEYGARDVKNILVNQSAEGKNGWVMQYFCGTDVAQFEGFNLFAKFDKGEQVLMAGNHRFLRDGQKNKYTEHASLYQLLSEDGLVLAFNTWNNILTPFVDPVYYGNAPDVLQKDGEGMQGDHNFVVTSYKEDEVILRGERHGAEVRLVACDRPWSEYIADTDARKKQIASGTINSYYVTNDVDTMYFVGLNNGRFRYCERVDDPLHIDSVACCFTPEGFRLEHQKKVGGTPFQEFTISDDATCLVNEDGSVKVMATWDNYIANRASIWYLDPDYFTEEQQNLFNQISAEIAKQSAAMSLARIGIGRSVDTTPVTGLVLTFYADANKRTERSIGMSLTMSKTAFGQMSIACTDEEKIDTNFKNVVSRGAADMETLARAFAATISGEYKIIPNDYFLPTGAVYEILGGPGVTFKLN